MSEPSTLLLQRENAVLWVRLNRPAARNGIDPTMRDELIAVLNEADRDPQVRALVLTGQGRDFCTGADLMPSSNPTVAVTPSKTALDYRRGAAFFQDLFKTLWELEIPVVSAVNGTTAGAGWML
ncbi:MAG: enoyl-CoA hydratase/isomerase family protein, partial [Actinomycetota bacterium]